MITKKRILANNKKKLPWYFWYLWGFGFGYLTGYLTK